MFNTKLVIEKKAYIIFILASILAFPNQAKVTTDSSKANQKNFCFGYTFTTIYISTIAAWILFFFPSVLTYTLPFFIKTTDWAKVKNGKKSGLENMVFGESK